MPLPNFQCDEVLLAAIESVQCLPGAATLFSLQPALLRVPGVTGKGLSCLQR
jgi:hypothetical protein